MIDVALVWNDAIFAADVAMQGPDLLLDDGLQTAVVISLLTDRLAGPDDRLPDGSGNRRGWWGDLACSADPPGWNGDRIGSRLWLLAREKAIPTTALLAQGYCQEALAWLLDDGLAQNVTVATEWISRTALGILVTILQDGQNQQFKLVWQATAQPQPSVA